MREDKGAGGLVIDCLLFTIDYLSPARQAIWVAHGTGPLRQAQDVAWANRWWDGYRMGRVCLRVWCGLFGCGVNKIDIRGDVVD